MQSPSTSTCLPSDVESRPSNSAAKSRQYRLTDKVKELERKSNLDNLKKCNAECRRQFQKQKQINENLEMECQFLQKILSSQDYIQNFVQKLNIGKISIKASDVITNILRDNGINLSNLFPQESEFNADFATAGFESFTLNPPQINLHDNSTSGIDAPFFNDDPFNLAYHTAPTTNWYNPQYNVPSSGNPDQYHISNPLSNLPLEIDSELPFSDFMDIDWSAELSLPDDASDIFADCRL